MSEPRVRLRINHSQTMKEGWRHETTVEVDYEGERGTDAATFDRLAHLLYEIDQLGRAETARRNAEDGR